MIRTISGGLEEKLKKLDEQIIICTVVLVNEIKPAVKINKNVDKAIKIT